MGGAPLVLGAQWDVLGGDLDKLASRQKAFSFFGRSRSRNSDLAWLPPDFLLFVQTCSSANSCGSFNLHFEAVPHS